MVVRSLRKIYDLNMDLGRDHNGRAHHIYDVPVLSLQGVPDARYCLIVPTLDREPTQIATLSQLQVQGEALVTRDGLADLRNNTQCTAIARQNNALTQPEPITSTKAGYQTTIGRPYVGPTKLAVHPAPLNVHRASSSAPADQRVDTIGGVCAAVILDNDIPVHKPTIKDTL